MPSNLVLCCLSALFLLDASPKVYAQIPLPSGSYLGSCKSVAVDSSNILHATCEKEGIGTIESTLQLPCVGVIDNLHGSLVCTKAPSGDAPAGSYFRSCTDIRVDGTVLRATCQSANYGPNQTWIVLPCDGSIGNLNGNLACTHDPVAPLDAIAAVTRYAPILKFTGDADGFGYPMSAQTFWARWTNNGATPGGIGDNFGVFENTDPTSLGKGAIPTYYYYAKYGNQVRISYWWFYGYQHPCWGSQGKHQGDWENVLVILKEDQSGVAAVRYAQHNGTYLRISGPRDAPCTPGGTGRCSGSSGFPSENGRPVVYVGRTAHGSYHDTYNGIAGVGSCAYYGDARSDSGPRLDSSLKLVDLTGSEEAWLAADRKGGFSWGPNGISTHPTQRQPSISEAACEGTATWTVGGDTPAGCYKSEALAGDDQASQNALIECKPGYDNAGLTCNKGVLPWDWSIYGRLNPGNFYNYNYTIPTNDAGLSRRRQVRSEWPN